MNLTKLFETQKTLDDRIIREKGLEGQDLLPMKILALQVELGELANEWRGFKFWSTDQEPRRSRKVRLPGYTHETIEYEDGTHGLNRVYQYEDSRDPLLEEYVDCLHFILSIGLERGLTDPDVRHGTQYKSTTMQFNRLFTKIGDFAISLTTIEYVRIWEMVIGLGQMLGFTDDQIEQAYMAKNAVNHSRQDRGY